MSPRKEAGAKGGLAFVGRSDYFVAGVPQSDLKVTAEPMAPDEVTAEQAAELVATGLYAEKAADHGAEGEVSNG
jgi:hypothetical protein